MVTQNLKIIMDNRKLPDIRMVSGDVGRDIFPAVYPSEDAEEALDLTVYQLRVIFIKPDNTFVIEDYLDGMIEIPEQAGAVTGRGFYQIRISKTGEEIYSGQGDFYIDDQILNDSMVESIAEVNGMQFPDDFLTAADLENYVTQDQIEDMATKTYVDDAIADIPDPLDIYSNDERQVGVWYDGKPLYEKTFYLSTLSTGYVLIPHDIANVGDIIFVNGGCARYYIASKWYSTPFMPYNSNNYGSEQMLIGVNTTDIFYRVGNDIRQNSGNAYVVLRYTKSTD